MTTELLYCLLGALAGIVASGFPFVVGLWIYDRVRARRGQR